MAKKNYHSGKGKVAFAVRADDGTYGPLSFTGNTPGLKFSLNITREDHIESESGENLQDGSFVKEKKADLTVTIDELSLDNAVRLFKGQLNTLAAATVTNQSLGTGRVVGDTIKLPHEVLSAFSLKDSAGSPATLVLGTDYTVDLNFGFVTILNLGSYTQPFKANYTAAARKSVTFLSNSEQEYYLFFFGINKGNLDKKVQWELYRCQLDPSADNELIGDTYAKFELKGKVLYDATRQSDPNFSRFGRTVFVDAIDV